MTAASIELLTKAGASLLLRLSINVNVIWSVLQILGYLCDARAIILSSPEHTSFSPVGPEDVLLIDSHSKWVRNTLQDHFSVFAGQLGPLNLASVERNGGKNENPLQNVSLLLFNLNWNHWTYSEESAQ